MSSSKIELLLKNDEDFAISQTFGFPFVDFKISHVGSTFESMIGDENSFVPSFERLYKSYMKEYGNQFENGININAIKGRVARMWASLIREWHAYYLIKEKGIEKGVDSNLIIRNDDYDTYKGIDIYLMNSENMDKSIKLDIYQSTKRASLYREIKDERRIKDYGIPGKKYRILLGKNTIPKYTKVINNWYLLSDEAAIRIVNYFIKS